MPRPAPRTVPVSRPITKLPPPPPSLSKRSYPSAIGFLLTLNTVPRFLVLGSRFRLQHAFERDAQAADEANDAAGFCADVGSDAIGGVVDAVHRAVNRLIDPLSFLFDPGRHGLGIVADAVSAHRH